MTSRRYVEVLSKHATLIVGVALGIFLISVGLSFRLRLHADLAELLPQNDPAITRLKRIASIAGTPATLVIAVQGSQPASNERFAEALVARLQPLIGHGLRAIDYRPDAARNFIEQHKFLYASLEELHRIENDLQSMIATVKNPAFVALDDPKEDLRLLRSETEARSKSTDHFPSGYYEGESGHLLAIITWTDSDGTGDAKGYAIRDAVAHAIEGVDPKAFGDVSAHLTGDVETAIEEHDALKQDVELISLVCSVLVLIVVMAYFRGPGPVVYIFLPTLVGVAASCGITALAIRSINTNTAFLGSIVLGNGINFGIIMLARYHEERASIPSVGEALANALARTAVPTLIAALSASVAYLSLTATRFRGFQQFGCVGAVGMALCWVATFTVGPALILIMDRKRDGLAICRRRSIAFSTHIASHPRATLLLCIVGTGLAAASVGRIWADPFEYDFRNLRNQDSRRHGAGALYKRVGHLFEHHISPAGIAVVDRLEDAVPFRMALLKKDCLNGDLRDDLRASSDSSMLGRECDRRVAAGEPTRGIVDDVKTIQSFLPQQQEAKLEVIERVRSHLAVLSSLLPETRREELTSWSLPAAFGKLPVGALPESVTQAFRTRDGTLGNIALIYPRVGFQGWDGRSLLRLADLMEDVRLSDGRVLNAAGRASIFAAMLREIIHDGPRASAFAMGGVTLLLIGFLRRLRSIGIILVSLALGMIWMAGAGAALGIKLNFLNFVALPVTLGIGVDYAVNILARIAGDPDRMNVEGIARTSSAIALCSLTTIIGYSSLLVASNGALRSFGLLADLGEVACLMAALVVIPAWIRCRGHVQVPGEQLPIGNGELI